jgi:hypothetical protein
MASAKKKSGATSTETAGSNASDPANADKGGANRRKFHRRDTHIVAQLTHNGVPVDGMVTNLSLEGCLFTPRLTIPVGDKVKLKLAGENKAVTATVKAVSDLGVHCLLHAGGATLGRLSVEVDDMALLMLNASRPHVVEPAAMPVAARSVRKKAAAKTKTAKKAVKKKAAPKKPTAPRKAAPKKPSASKKTAGARKKTVTGKKAVGKKAVRKKAAKKTTAVRSRRR